jgi:hypothetical protein
MDSLEILIPWIKVCKKFLELGEVDLKFTVIDL